MDVGTLYTETDPSSLSGARLRPLAKRRARALPDHLMRLLSGEYEAPRCPVGSGLCTGCRYCEAAREHWEADA